VTTVNLVDERLNSRSGLDDPADTTSVGNGRWRRRVADVGLLDGLLVMSVGVALVAFGYARGRAELTYGTHLYWIGQVVVFVTVLALVVRRSTPDSHRNVLVLAYAACQSAIRWAYSPHGFTFSDELQHLRALNNVLESNHLFEANYSLPISPRFPGLENVTSELARVASIGAFPAGVVIASVTHVLAAGCVLLLFREITRSSRVAAIGAVVYLLNPHAAYFNTSFLYETLALPFAALALTFSIRFATRSTFRWRNFYATVACTFVVAATHHVTAIATAVMILGIAAMTMFSPRTRTLSASLAVCGTAAASTVALWIFAVAPVTIEYLGLPAQQLLSSISSFLTFSAKLSLPGPPQPLFDRIVGPAGLLLTLLLIAYNLKRRKQCRPLEVTWTVIALGLYGIAIAVRIAVSNGSEFSGRLLTYAALFSALVVGMVFARITSGTSEADEPFAGERRSQGVLKGTAIIAMGVLLLASSIVTSLPAWWQRIPGGFWIEGFASGIDSVGLSRAEWARAYLQPGMRYAGDITSITLLSTIGKLDPVKDPGAIYYSDPMTPEVVAHIKTSAIIYADVDLRMAQYVPINGKFFTQDLQGSKVRDPIPMGSLTKFDRINGVSRIYDSGIARFYDFRGGKDAPYAR
jgi:hypothetical protein